MAQLLWVLGVSLSISFLCSILEAVLLSVTPSFVAVLRDGGSRAGEWLAQMQRRIDEPIAAILTLNTIAHTIGAAVSGAIVQREFGDEWLTAFSVVLTLVILVLSEIIPKTLGATLWKQLAKPSTFILRWLVVLMKPILVPLGLLQRLFQAGGHGPTVSRAEIEVLAEIGRREGTLDQHEWEVMTNVMNLDQVTAGQVMTPRTDIVAVAMDATSEEAQAVMLDEGHLRLPVHTGSLDQIEGILLARDLWRSLRDGEKAIEDIVRPAMFIPAAKPAEELIREMRAARAKMAIVLDDFGGTAGLVTFEDLIEEIVGEIQDEHEIDEPVDFEALGEGRHRIWGGAPVREVNERLGLALDEDMHETLAGYLFGRLGRIGRIGDEIEVERGLFRVTDMRGRRIEYSVYEPVDASAKAK